MYYDPQSAEINLQSPQSDSTPWTLTLRVPLTYLPNIRRFQTVFQFSIVCHFFSAYNFCIAWTDKNRRVPHKYLPGIRVGHTSRDFRPKIFFSFFLFSFTHSLSLFELNSAPLWWPPVKIIMQSACWGLSWVWNIIQQKNNDLWNLPLGCAPTRPFFIMSITDALDAVVDLALGSKLPVK